MLLPVAQQQHLRGERRVSVDGVERRGQRDARLVAVGANDRVAAVDANVGVDVDEAVALAGRLERHRREIGLRAQRGRQLHAAAAVGEVEVGGQLQIVALADDLEALVPDGFLDVVQPQRPALDGRRVLREAREESDRACDEHDSHAANHNSGWPLQRAG